MCDIENILSIELHILYIYTIWIVRNYGAKWQKDADFNGLVFPGTSENQVIFWLRNMEKPQCCGLVQQIQEKPFGG